jgi:hypothetical protein
MQLSVISYGPREQTEDEAKVIHTRLDVELKRNGQKLTVTRRV